MTTILKVLNTSSDNSKSPSRRRRTLIVGLLALALPVVGFFVQFQQFRHHPIQPSSEQILQIKSGSSFQQISRRLAESGVIDDAFYFRLLGRIQGVTGQMQAGEYLFKEAASPEQILARLVSGDIRRFPFTVPEGLTLTDIATRYEKDGFGTTEAFLQAARNPALLKKFLPRQKSLEGYLFPETYTLDSSTTADRLITAMLDEFNRRLTPELVAAGEKRGLNRHQLVTMASIVQKEAGNTDEMPLIAAVFHNRLQRRIPLQADPTVIYGIENFDGNLTRKHLKTPTPYNTYTHAGLPPGPIANPGMDALQAAAYPADVDYMYFVARGDGTHAFSRTLKEHNQAVRRFQLRR